MQIYKTIIKKGMKSQGLAEDRRKITGMKKHRNALSSTT